MKYIRKSKHNKGFIFLDILIAVTIIGIAFIALLGVGAASLRSSSLIKNTTQADSLIKEEIEAVRSFRDGTDWSIDGLGTVNKGSSNPYYVSLDTSSSPSKWSLLPGTETIGIFTRNIVFDNVSRDPGTKNVENIYNQSHDDPDTIRVTVTVSWPNKTSQVVAYLTNWQK